MQRNKELQLFGSLNAVTALPNSDGYKSLSAEAYQQKLSATNILDLI